MGLNIKKNRQIPEQHSDKLNVTILAGGSGTRLWPLSRQSLPKQFLSLAGEKILMELTIKRLRPYVSSKNILIVTNEQHANGEAYQTLSPYQMLLEPVGRNTAPAIAIAAAWLRRHSNEPDPIMIVLPADHIIQNIPAFHKALEQAVKEAADGSLVTFGICPTRPDTGFGYIKTATTSSPVENVLQVERFIEKPDFATASQYLQEGNYFWNSGMFVWRAATILKCIKQHLPEVHRVLNEITNAWDQGDDAQQSVSRIFPSMPTVSIDIGVMEKVAANNSSNLKVIPCDISWSDIGSWDAVHEILKKDTRNNVAQGNVLAIDCDNTLIHSNHRLITAIGVKDICLIETADAILVAKRGETQRVCEIVDALKKCNAQEQINHLTVYRPWGSYTVLEEQPGFKIKRITVNPGAILSLQRHQQRSEHWTVVSGTATVVCGEELLTVITNQSVYIPVRSKHRLENKGKIPVQLIEVQVGEYLGEDDIERFNDVYGRC